MHGLLVARRHVILLPAGDRRDISLILILASREDGVFLHYTSSVLGPAPRGRGVRCSLMTGGDAGSIPVGVLLTPRHLV